MLDKGIKTKYGEKFILCAYLMTERLKRPIEREFGAYMDLLPKSCIEFPIFFDEDELAQLEGSPFKELLEDIQVGIDLIYDDICRLVPAFK